MKRLSLEELKSKKSVVKNLEAIKGGTPGERPESGGGGNSSDKL